MSVLGYPTTRSIRTALIEVRSVQTKNSSSARKEAAAALRLFGFKKLKIKELCSIYKLEGSFSESDLKKIAEEILCDPVAQKFFIDKSPPNSKTLFLDVWYKPGVADPVGDTILKAVREIEIFKIEKAFSGIRYELLLPNGSRVIEKEIKIFANRNLLNPLVQECKITTFSL